MRLSLIFAVTLAACFGDNLPPDEPPDVPPAVSQRERGNCFIGGCSMEACTPDEPEPSPCIYNPAFACYRDATCEPQPGGACGWTPTPELTACLAPFTPHN
jgi:hypothetical protein